MATISLWTGVSPKTIYNICRLYNSSSTLDPKPFPGKQSKLTAKQLEDIRLSIEAQNDITLEELIEKLDLPIKKSRLSELINGMDFSFKKRLCTLKINSGKTLSKNVKNGGKAKKT